MFTIILQIAESPLVVETPPELTIAELLMKGGIIMIPILLLLFIATYFFIERLLYIRAVTKKNKDLIPSIKRYIHEGDVKSARIYAQNANSAIGNILSHGIEHIGKPIREIETIMESSANIEIAQMEKNMGYLGIIAGIAPMLGFIGTILGIIRIFYNISLSDNISIGIIAGGLYEKMITSGSGLVVGVVAYSAYHLLNQMINRFSLQLQKDSYEFMRSILSPAK